MSLYIVPLFFFFFFNDTATTEIYTLSLHDALPIWPPPSQTLSSDCWPSPNRPEPDRKSTRLNSSHANISYAVFCLKKKKKKKIEFHQKKKKNTNKHITSNKKFS